MNAKKKIPLYGYRTPWYSSACSKLSYYRFRFYKGLIYSGDIFHINILGQSVIFDSVVLHVPYMVWLNI